MQVGGEARGAVARRARRGCRCSRGSGRRGSGRASCAPPPRRRAPARSTSCSSPSESSDGIRPLASRDGSGGSSRGASSTSRRGDVEPVAVKRARRRCTACPALVSIVADVDRVQPRVRAQLDPGVPKRGAARSPRLRANGLTSWVTWIASAPTSSASSASSRSGLPWRMTSPSRARAARASSSARHSSRNWVRGPGRVAAVQQPVVEAEDGTTRSWRSSAARSAGWSRTRRSRRNQTMPSPASGSSSTYPRALGQAANEGDRVRTRRARPRGRARRAMASKSPRLNAA